MRKSHYCTTIFSYSSFFASAGDVTDTASHLALIQSRDIFAEHGVQCVEACPSGSSHRGLKRLVLNLTQKQMENQVHVGQHDSTVICPGEKSARKQMATICHLELLDQVQRQ